MQSPLDIAELGVEIIERRPVWLELHINGGAIIKSSLFILSIWGGVLGKIFRRGLT